MKRKDSPLPVRSRRADEGRARAIAPVPARLLELQALAGNAAVTHALQGERNADRALEVADEVLRRSRRGDWRHPESELGDLSPLEVDLVWDLYKAASRHVGVPGPSDPGVYLEDLAWGERKVHHLLAGFHPHDRARRQKAGAHAASIAREAEALRADLYAEQAQRDAAGEAHLSGLDPTESAERERLLKEIQESLHACHSIADALHKVAEGAGVAQHMKNLERASETLETLHTLVEAWNPQTWADFAREWHEQTGSGEKRSLVGAAATATEKVKFVGEIIVTVHKTMLQGLGWLFKAQHLGEEATEMFEAAEELGKKAGTVFAIAGVVHGALAFANSKASTQEKADALVDLTTGLLSLPGAAGASLVVPIVATWMMFKWIGSEVAEGVLGAAHEHDLRHSYAELKPLGDAGASQLQTTGRIVELAEKATGGARRAGYARAAEGARTELQRTVAAAATAWQRVPQRPLAGRFPAHDPSLQACAADPRSDVHLVMAAAAVLLQGLLDAARDFAKVKRQVLRDEGFAIPEPEPEEGNTGGRLDS